MQVRNPDDPKALARTCEDWAMRGVYAVPAKYGNSTRRGAVKRKPPTKVAKAASHVNSSAAEDVAESPAKAADPPGPEEDGEQARH